MAGMFPDTGFMLPKELSLIFILIIASQLSASSAGRQQKLMDSSVLQLGDAAKVDMKVKTANKLSHQEETVVARPRFLTVETNDYGRYNPAPTFRKPRFKLIPN